MRKFLLISLSLLLLSCISPIQGSLSLLSSTRIIITQDGYVLDCQNKQYQDITINANSVTVRYCNAVGSISNQGGIDINGNNNVIINNTVSGACMVGIDINGNNNIIEGNDISGSRQCAGTSGADADGIRVFGDGNKIINNRVHSISLVENPTAHIDCIQSFGVNLTNVEIIGNVCDVAHSGVQIDSGYKITGMTIMENVFRASRPLNLYVDGVLVKNNVFIGKSLSENVNGTFVSFRDSKNITFTNNIILNTTVGILTQTNATTLGGNNVFWNDSGVAPRRDSGYSGNASNLKWKSDKWQTINPMLDSNYLTGNLSICYAGLGCVPATATPTVTPTRTPTSTLTQTITPTNTVTSTPTPRCDSKYLPNICIYKLP